MDYDISQFISTPRTQPFRWLMQIVRLFSYLRVMENFKADAALMEIDYPGPPSQVCRGGDDLCNLSNMTAHFSVYVERWFRMKGNLLFYFKPQVITEHMRVLVFYQ